MSPEERQMISGLFDRVRDAERAPRDRDAEAYIASRAKESPNAAYTLAQVVLVQEQALGAAQRRIEELEADLREALRQAAPAPQQGGGFLSSIFGGGAPARPSGPSWSREPQRPPQGFGQQGQPGYGAPPPPQGGPWGGGPQQQGGPWGGQPGFGAAQQPARGGGFLTGALTTAAGVAGGMMLANSIQGLFKSDPKLAETAGAGHQTAAADQSALSDLGSSNDVWPADQGEMRDGGFHNASSLSYDAGGVDDGGGFDDGGFDDV